MNFNYIPLHASTKIPIHKKWAEKYQTIKPSGNYGVLAGKINNIIIVDIDNKDNGLSKWNELIELHDEPETYTVETGSGGYHYYFNYNEVIKNIIKLKIDGISYGIDILTDGKFAVGAGSIHPKTNKKYTIDNQAAISNMPEWLLGLIVASYNVKKPTIVNDNIPIVKQTTNTKIFDKIDDAKFTELLNELPNEYLNSYDKWLQITAVCKNHDKKEVWDKWSKKSANYNFSSNINIWNTLKFSNNVNFIASILEKPPFRYTYDYTPITDTKNITRVEQNNRYLNIEEIKNDTIIVKSDTGTGKTTSVCKMLKDEENILSIVSRCSLVNQHIISFDKVNVKIVSYEAENIHQENKICCQIDSIVKINLSNIDKYCVYLDEVNSTINYLLNSSTLVNRRDKVFKTFSYIIKNCRKLIVSDADISDVVFEFIDNYRIHDNIIYVDNIFKNYNNIKAIHYNEVDEMIKKMSKIISSKNRGFVATFDSLKEMNRIYQSVFVKDKENKFIKISSEDDDFKDTDWDGKYVFFTPKIIYGIDYVPVDDSVDVFVFSKGGSIDPIQIAQQATRCRKIKELHYNINTHGFLPKYDSYDECKTKILSNLEMFIDKLEGIYLDDNLEYTIRECIFNKLYLYSVYVNNIITSNYRYHFDRILEKKGFILSVVGGKEVKGLDKEKVKELDLLAAKERDNIIECIIENKPIEGREQLIKAINKRIYDILKLSDDEQYMKCIDYFDDFKFILRRHKDVIFDSKRIQEHFKTCKLLFNDKLIFNTFSGINRKDFNIKHMDTTEAKIFMIVKLERLLTIDKYDIDKLDYAKLKDEVVWSENDHKLYQYIFKSRIKYDNSYYHLYKMLGHGMKNISPAIVKSNTTDLIRNGVRIKMTYEIDMDKIREHIELYGYRDNNLLKIDPALLNKFGINIEDSRCLFMD